MAPTTRKRVKTVVTPNPAGANVAGFSQAAEDRDDESLSDSLPDQDSNESDFEAKGPKTLKRKRGTGKGTGKNTKPKRRPTLLDGPPLLPLPLPDLSDEEDDFTDDESAGALDDDGLWSKNEVSQTLVHHAGAAVINTTLEDFLKNSNIVELLKNPNMVNLLKNAGLEITSVSTNKALPENTESSNGKIGFLDLPAELREKVYGLLWIFDKPVEFNIRQNHCHSAQFLKTCKKVYDEGRVVLYGENSFHFSRDTRVRGEFHDKIWKEVAYKGVRKFFNTIRPTNIQLLKHVSFSLTDALDNRSRIIPGTIEHRKFVDDPHVHEIFRQLGANATLKTFAILFGGRGMVTTKDRRLVRGVTDVKCYKFIIITYFYGRNYKCALGLKNKMKHLMGVRDENFGYATLPEPKNPVNMVYSPQSEPLRQYVRFEELI